MGKLLDFGRRLIGADTGDLEPVSPPSEQSEHEVIDSLLRDLTDAVSAGDEVGVRGDMVLGGLTRYLQALPHPTDDIDEILESSICKKMMLDATINSTIHWLVAAATDRDMQYNPFVRDKSHPDYKTSMKVYDFVMRAIEPAQDQFHGAWNDMGVNALVHGNCLTEKVAPLQEFGPDSGKRYLTMYKPRSHDVVRYVVDPHNNVLGVACQVAQKPSQDGETEPISVRRDGEPTQMVFTQGSELPDGWKVFPRQKFSVMTFRSEFNDPRGKKVLRHIYNEWYLTQAIWPHWLKYLIKFASPSIRASLGPNEHVTRAGGKLIDPLDRLYESLKRFENSSVIATRHGAELDLLYSNGEGNAFNLVLAVLERRILRGLTNQILANSETRNGSRAQAQTHQDQQNVVVRVIKRMIATMHRNDDLKFLIEINLGKEFTRFAPIPVLGGVAPEDMADAMNATAALWRSGYMHRSQLREHDSNLGLPYREAPEPGFYPSSAVDQEAFEEGPQLAAPAEKGGGKDKDSEE